MRLLTVLLLAALVLSLQFGAAPLAASGPLDPPAATPNLILSTPFTDNMECPTRATQSGIQGAVPAGWTGIVLNPPPGAPGQPDIENDRWYFGGATCGEPNPPWTFIERMEGQDSWVFMSAGWKTPPVPDNRFDAALYQQIRVTTGRAYSLSAWMISLCGGADPMGYCPVSPDYYIAKMIGIDPTGGTNPLGSSVQWIENRTPHQINGQRTGWQNLRMAATAQAVTMTLFARVKTGLPWSANQAFLDAVKLVQAPTASFVNLPAQVQGRTITVTWDGSLGPDIPAIQNGNYHLYFDLQYRFQGSPAGWQPWFTADGPGSASFSACSGDLNPVVYFRLLPRAEQPPCPAGQRCNWAYPNHRFPGVWTDSAPVQVNADSVCVPVAFLSAMVK